jgi:hypothetical protein
LENQLLNWISSVLVGTDAELYSFGHPENMLRHTVVAALDVELVRDHDSPRIENFPGINISVDFKKPTPRDVTAPGNPIGSGW